MGFESCHLRHESWVASGPVREHRVNNYPGIKYVTLLRLKAVLDNQEGAQCTAVQWPYGRRARQVPGAPGEPTEPLHSPPTH